MQTSFSPDRLAADPGLQEAESILRKCVHCGFCTATCPTYALLGDELDSPRGRIYLLKDMLENDKPASEKVVKHVDRCLTCLSCMTTCPSGVDYNHLVEKGRVHIAETYTRPPMDRFTRWLLAMVLPYTGRFRLAMTGGWLARPLAGLLPGAMRAMVDQARRLPAGPRPIERPQVLPAEGTRRARMVMPTGCVQPALKPTINEATARLLTRHGVEVVIPAGQGCCGALVQHMGEEEKARAFARANIDAWWPVFAGEGGLDAVVINASGCGSTIKDYGHLLAGDPAYGDKAKVLAEKARDITEVLSDLGLKAPVGAPGAEALRVAYHSACSLQHGQRVREAPKTLLRQAGFDVQEIAESHLCCGSAGTYSILQPELSRQLRDRKVTNLEATKPQVIAAGNIGCLGHIEQGTGVPVVHTAELLDWATGGPKPAALG